MASPTAICPMADVIDKIRDPRYNDNNVFTTKTSEDDFAAEPLVNNRQDEQRLGDKILNMFRLCVNKRFSLVMRIWNYAGILAQKFPSDERFSFGLTQGCDCQILIRTRTVQHEVGVSD